MIEKSDISNLQLNQNSFQDFLDCQRRFQLRVIDDLSWPAATAEPYDKFEKATYLGNQFHLLCHQFFEGVPAEVLELSISDPVLLKMWEKFFPFGSELKNRSFFSEQMLSYVFENRRLIAKFDLLVKLHPSHYLIIDWKTSPSKPPHHVLKDRVQTYLYPFMLCQSGSELFNVPEIHPDWIEMHYWFPLDDQPQEIFPYSKDTHTSISSKLRDLISSVNEALSTSSDLPLTADLNQCKYCIYRSLCDRGSKPGNFDQIIVRENEDLSNEHFDLGQIKELEF